MDFNAIPWEPPLKDGEAVSITDDKGNLIAKGTFVLEDNGFKTGEVKGKIVNLMAIPPHMSTQS